MRWLILSVLLLISPFIGKTQTVRGFVLNKETRLRLAKVYIFNTRTNVGIYNNGVGEFSITAQKNDRLIASLEGYHADTVVFNEQSAIYFQLQPTAIQIRQVDITLTRATPEEQRAKTLREYKYATDRGSSKNLFTLSNGTAGIGIDAIYNLLSRQGKNARHLQEILDHDYRESLIDYRYKPEMIARILNIRNPELQDFMKQFRPSYLFTMNANDYTFTQFIKNSYKSYKRNPAAYRLPTLPKLSEDSAGNIEIP